MLTVQTCVAGGGWFSCWQEVEYEKKEKKGVDQTLSLGKSYSFHQIIDCPGGGDQTQLLQCVCYHPTNMIKSESQIVLFLVKY